MISRSRNLPAMSPSHGSTIGASHSPLEEFLRDYAEITGGLWDEVEPQVYDLMLPARDGAGEPEMVRLAFDPEAIPEHPGAQLASYGTPLVDRLLADAVNRGRHVELYMVGLNLAPQGLEDRLRRAVTLPPGFAPQGRAVAAAALPPGGLLVRGDVRERPEGAGPLDGGDRRALRPAGAAPRAPARSRTHLAEKPWSPLAEAPHPGLASAYPIARDRVVRTLSALANTYHRELHERLDRQLERIGRYYGDLRAEVEEQAQKARNRGEDPARFTARLEASTREEQLRTAELRRKSQLKVHLRLLNLLVIHQPKLLLHTCGAAGSDSGRLEWVWDPLVEAVEAAVCPECRHPTFEFAVTRQGRLVCPACAASRAPTRREKGD